MTSRREFLQYLLGATAVTAAGLVVPARTTYSFLLNNPLSDEEILRKGITASYVGYGGRSAFARALQHEIDELKAAYFQDLNLLGYT